MSGIKMVWACDRRPRSTGTSSDTEGGMYSGGSCVSTITRRSEPAHIGSAQYFGCIHSPAWASPYTARSVEIESSVPRASGTSKAVPSVPGFESPLTPSTSEAIATNPSSAASAGSDTGPELVSTSRPA